MPKRVAILGSTGSIGRQALEVFRAHPERLRVVGLSAGRNWELLAQQAAEFGPEVVSVDAEADAQRVRMRLGDRLEVHAGEAGLKAVALWPTADIVLVAVTGTAGLVPTVEAIQLGKDVALANKETLVVAGELVTELATGMGVQLLPVDSEHSAIWQCVAHRRTEVTGIILTASGGPFRRLSREEMEQVTPESALRHPTWKMGPKITVDSATLMNKGLEVIEARWLFDVDYDNIEVTVHPQSIIHGMARLRDGQVLACLGSTDMRLPIQYALSYPQRWEAALPPVDFHKLEKLTFEAPDLERFPSLDLAYQAGRAGGTMPCVLNAANEVAVAAFLQGRLVFTDIPRVVAGVMKQHKTKNRPGLAEILDVDRWAREAAAAVMERVG
ncbi:MAG: 1-deoxy-D-xylulose-5-phosphate reductoisomerase [Candidatus Desulforudis sp.]|nr:1-deoxy-D-xylulose-5-phosphate reductoisomerase [Desulforudis sp.]